MDAGLHVDEPAPAALVFFSFLCGHTFVWPVALLGRHVFFILGHLVAAARYARAHCLQTQLCWRRRAAAAARWELAPQRSGEQSSLDRLPEKPKASEQRCSARY